MKSHSLGITDGRELKSLHNLLWHDVHNKFYEKPLNAYKPIMGDTNMHAHTYVSPHKQSNKYHKPIGFEKVQETKIYPYL